MKLTRRTTMSLMGATAATAMLGSTARASGTVHEVQMLNKHPDSNDGWCSTPTSSRHSPATRSGSSPSIRRTTR